MAEKKDPYEVERKPPVISHIVGRKLRNREAFGALPTHGRGPIAGRSRVNRGVEPPSPVKSQDRRQGKGAPISGSAATSGSPEFKVDPPERRVDQDALPNQVLVRFEGDPRTHEYNVFIDESNKCIGAVRRTVCDTDKMKTVWEAENGTFKEEYPSRLVAAYELWQRFGKKA